MNPFNFTKALPPCSDRISSYNAATQHVVVGGNGYVFVYSISVGKDRTELKPIVFFNDHSSFVTNVTCTADGRLYTTGLDRLVCMCAAPITALCLRVTLLPLQLRPNQRRFAAVQGQQTHSRRRHHILRVRNARTFSRQYVNSDAIQIRFFAILHLHSRLRQHGQVLSR